MGIKMPQFSSCCFCLPLRTGLLTLGYINLLYHVLICILVVIVAFWITVLSLGMGGKFPPLEWALLLPLVTGSEVVFNILVVVATHKKNARLLKLTFIAGTALWIFTVPYCICITYRFGKILPDYYPEDQLKLATYMTAATLEPIVLGYVLLLVRSLKSTIRTEIPGVQYSELDRNREARADYERLLPYTPCP